jgi:eukaryotic-like serine/threonine-protein kinase
MRTPDDDLETDPIDRGVLGRGTIVGSYRIERLIAEGGMGSVYEAVHAVLPRRVAIKVVHRHLLDSWSARERLFQEARILEALDHAGLVRLYDAGLLGDESRPWLAMELLDGVTLAQCITVHGKMAPLEVVEVLDQVAAALDTAHQIGVVHRDLKPENVIIHRDGDELVCKVIDWGIARVSGVPSGRLTAANMTPGTPLYMSPEQARGKLVDGRSDIYTLGVIASEALAGEPPFQGDSPLDVVVQHLTIEPPVLRGRVDIPAELDELILEMLAKEPEDRPSLPEVRHRLAAVAAALRAPPRGVDDDYEEMTLEIELVADPRGAALPAPAWTPPRVIASTGDRHEAAGEIRTTRRLRRSQLGRSDLPGLIVTALLTAVMLALALALPAFELRSHRDRPPPVVDRDVGSTAAGAEGGVLVNIAR